MIDSGNVVKALEDSYRYSNVEEEFTLVHQDVVLSAIALLKEQEIGHWVVLENCANAGVYCSECHTKIFDHYPMKKKLSYFCPHCGTRMEGQAVKENEEGQN